MRQAAILIALVSIAINVLFGWAASSMQDRLNAQQENTIIIVEAVNNLAQKLEALEKEAWQPSRK